MITSIFLALEGRVGVSVAVDRGIAVTARDVVQLRGLASEEARQLHPARGTGAAWAAGPALFSAASAAAASASACVVTRRCSIAATAAAAASAASIVLRHASCTSLASAASAAAAAPSVRASAAAVASANAVGQAPGVATWIGFALAGFEVADLPGSGSVPGLRDDARADRTVPPATE